MPESKEPLALIPFGPFEADLASQELRKQGVRLRLPRQSFQILKMLLERPGELVSREELRQALWPSDTFVDFEHGLNAAINRLREVLGDNADNPHYIETLPRRGYRFVGTIAQPELVKVTVTVKEKGEESEPPRNTNRRKLWAIGVGLAGLCGFLTLAFYSLNSPAPLPRVLQYRHLTADRQIKGLTPCGSDSRLVTEGPRVLFSETSASVVQVSSGGGDVTKVSMPFSCFSIFDISPDKTELIGVSWATGYLPDQPLWALSIASGLARRLGNLTGHTAAWSPDGRRIAYATGDNVNGPNTLYVAQVDGSDVRMLARIESGNVSTIRWSPNGRLLRMTVWIGASSSLWEVSANGTNLHRMNLFSAEGRPVLDLNWTPDGRYFVLGMGRPMSPEEDIWVVRETHSLLHWRTAQPVQLTTGAMSFGNAAPSRDANQIFAIGGQPRGELARYDLKSHVLVPYLSGISAEQLDYSRDGEWLTYVTFPEGILWRGKLDGSEHMQLTSHPLRAGLPRFSPDGKRIVFAGSPTEGALRLYVVSAEGGKPEVVSQSQDDEVDPNWSPDGSSLIFGGLLLAAQPRISSVDLRTGRVSTIPGSEGLFSPRVSPDGRFIVAIDAPGDRKLLLFGRSTGKWTELLRIEHAGIGWPVWSSDSKLIYVSDASDRRTPIVYRIRISDHKIERVAALEVPEGITGTWGGWYGVTPDGSPLVLRDLSIQEIYALDVDLP